jgi:hypothetical protein
MPFTQPVYITISRLIAFEGYDGGVGECDLRFHLDGAGQT